MLIRFGNNVGVNAKLVYSRGVQLLMAYGLHQALPGMPGVIREDLGMQCQNFLRIIWVP